MKKIAVLTLGCKVNQYESEAIANMLRNDGYEVFSEYKSGCDAYIINTCSVTNMSDRKSRQMIRKCVKSGKSPENKPYVAVMGCYSQAKPEEAECIDGVDFICGNENKTQIVKNIREYFERSGKIEKNENWEINLRTDGFDFPMLTGYDEKTRAIVKIQDGCDSFCSYCIIPYLRGRCRSRDINEILNEIQKLSENGYKEIVLAGIHVCNYGKDLENMSFPKLLREIEKIDGIERIRLSSVEPLAFTEEFFSYFKASKKLCPHFHISLQSGSDTVIKRMNRHYTAEYFLNTVEKLCEINENTSVTTDIIVGFPEESDEEFQQTVELAKKVRFLKIHTFKYSKRNGTAAAKMKNQISDEIKEKRSKAILELSDKCEQEILNSYIGKTLNVLFEERKGEWLFGLSENYIPVCIPYDETQTGKIGSVKIEKTEGLVAYGSLL